MSKKELPKRLVSFKLEKHPTTERLDKLRAQGIESVEDLDRLSVPTAENTALVSPGDSTVATATATNNNPAKGAPVSGAVATSGNTDETNSIRQVDDNIINSSAIPTVISKAGSTINAQNRTTTIPTANSTTIQPVALSVTIAELQQSHSSSAATIYQLLTDLANQRGKVTLRIGTKELLTRTAIRSHVTVRKAIDELIVKCSIQIIEANQGKIPPVYKIIAPAEIARARAVAGINIDEDTKFAFQEGSRIWPPAETTAATTTVNTNLATAIPTTTKIPEKAQFSKNQHDEKRRQVLEICQALAVENDIVDIEEQLADYPLPHIIIGICQQVAQQEGSKELVKVSECLPKIAQHFRQMRALPESILAQVAYENFAKLTSKS